MFKLSQTLTIVGLVASLSGSAFALNETDKSHDKAAETAAQKAADKAISDIQDGNTGAAVEEQSRAAHKAYEDTFAGRRALQESAKASRKNITDAQNGIESQTPKGPAIVLSSSDITYVIEDNAVAKYSPKVLTGPINPELQKLFTSGVFEKDLEGIARIITAGKTGIDFISKVANALDAKTLTKRDKAFFGELALLVAGADAADIAGYNTPSGIQDMVDIATQYRQDGGDAEVTEAQSLKWIAAYKAMNPSATIAKSVDEGFVGYLRWGLPVESRFKTDLEARNKLKSMVRCLFARKAA